MTGESSCGFRNWRDKYEIYKHYSTLYDYESEEIIEEEKYRFREEFWDYLEENGYWD